MYCSKCGTKQNDGEKFCPNCGTKFEEVTSASVEIVSNDAEVRPVQSMLELQEPVKAKIEDEPYISKYITDTDSLIKKAKKGDIPSLLRLAFRYECGLGVKQDERKAEELYMEVENKGFSKDYLNSESLIRMGYIIIKAKSNKEKATSDKKAGKTAIDKKKKIIKTRKKIEPRKVYGYKQNEKTGEMTATFLLPLNHPSIQNINNKVMQYNAYAETNGYNKITLNLTTGLIEGTFERKNKEVGFFQRLLGAVGDSFMETHFLEICKLCEMVKA